MKLIYLASPKQSLAVVVCYKIITGMYYLVILFYVSQQALLLLAVFFICRAGQLGNLGCHINSKSLCLGGRGADREVTLRIKHGVEAKSYENVSTHLSI